MKPFKLTVKKLQVRTVEQLRSLIEKMIGVKMTDDQLIWANCTYQAASLEDARRKDVAEMFKSGIEPMNTLKHVQDTIDVMYEDESEDDSAIFFVQHIVQDIFGNFDYDEQFEELNILKNLC